MIVKNIFELFNEEKHSKRRLKKSVKTGHALTHIASVTQFNFPAPELCRVEPLSPGNAAANRLSERSRFRIEIGKLLLNWRDPVRPPRDVMLHSTVGIRMNV